MQLLRSMGRYARLHDNRVHTDHGDRIPAQRLSNRVSYDTADQAKEVKYRHVGGSSGRLGAAVQRAMAMRERQTTPASEVKGIGAMRHLCNINNTLSASAECKSIAEEEEGNESNKVLSPLAGLQSESMRYQRLYCPASIADEDQYSRLNNAPQRSAKVASKKKGFFRKLFWLHKKPTSTISPLFS